MRHLTGDNYQKMKQERDRYAEIFLRTVEQGVQQGQFKPISARLSVFYILGALNSMYTWYQPEKGDAKEIAKLFSTLTIDALKRGGDAVHGMD